MRIVIPTTGSRGDVQPYLALGKGLRDAGHEVRLVTHDDFERPARSLGLDLYPVGQSSRALHQAEEGRRMARSGGNPFTFLRSFGRLRLPLIADLMARSAEAARAADLVLLTPTAYLVGLSVAEKYNLPAWSTTFLPSCANRCLPLCFFPEAPEWLPGRRLYNIATYLLGGEYLWQLVRTTVNRARREVLGLPPLPLLGPPRKRIDLVPTLHGYSRHVVDRPTDWGPHHHLTGFWFLQDQPGWQPPPELSAFLADGPAPVCVGFGSVPDASVEERTQLILAALGKTGQRGILLTGWGGAGKVKSSRRLFVTEAVPHSWLFPRVAAVVHHGGAGTTAAGLRAGLPSILIPYTADQFFWGRRVAALGVGPRAIPRQRLTLSRLIDALRAATAGPEMSLRAAALGEKLRAEDGVRQAVELLVRTQPAAKATVCAPTPAPDLRPALARGA